MSALYWILSAGLIACTALTVLKLTGSARAAVAHWGELTEVQVATRSLDAGETLADDDLMQRVVPTALLPDSTPIDDAVGLVVVTPMVAGDVIVEARVAPTGVTGPAALLRAGQRAVTLPRDAAVPPVEVGDRVDLVTMIGIPGDVGGSPFGQPDVLAVGAMVIDQREESLTVAVDADRAPAVASASVQGLLAVLLSSPANPPADAGEAYGPRSGPSGRQSQYRAPDDDPVDDERGEASSTNEPQEPPHRGEPGDAGGRHAHPEGGQEVGGDPVSP